MEDRGARLWPRHLWGLRLWGLRAEAGNGKGVTWVRNILKHRHITTAVPSCSEQKSNPAVAHTPPSVTHALKWSKTASPLSMEHNVGSGLTKKMDKHSAHSIKRTAESFLITSLDFLQWPVVLWWFDSTEPHKWHIKPSKHDHQQTHFNILFSSAPIAAAVDGQDCHYRLKMENQQESRPRIMFMEHVVCFNSNMIPGPLQKRQDNSSKSCDMLAPVPPAS